MGEYYVNYQVRADSAEPVRAMTRRACNGLAYVAPPRNGWVAVYHEASDAQDEAMLRQVAHDLSEGLAAAVFAFLVDDGNVLLYFLYERGELVAEFNSWPDYHRPVGGSEGDAPEVVTPGSHPDQLLLFDIGEPRPAPVPGNPEAILRHCRPGTTLEEVREFLRQDSWPAIEEAHRDGWEGGVDALARHAGLARLLGIDERLVHLGFDGLEQELDLYGLRALPGVRKVRGKATGRPLLTAKPPGTPRSLAGAVAAGDVESVRRFLAAGADPNEQDRFGTSLLSVAAAGGNFEIALALLAAGGRPSAVDAVGLLMRAVSFGRPRSCRPWSPPGWTSPRWTTRRCSAP